jgi:hypothetical protein
MYAGYWVKKEEQEFVERFQFYTKFGTEKLNENSFITPLRKLANHRMRNNFFKFPIEKNMIDFVRHKIMRRENR